MKAQDLMAKSNQATASAKVLLDTGDSDGACNRAYYAMFDAARAALLASGVSGKEACQFFDVVIKVLTYRFLVNFEISLEFVIDGGLPFS